MRFRYAFACGLAALSIAVAGCTDDDITTSSAPSGAASDSTATTDTAAAQPEPESADRRPKPEVEIPDGAPPKQLETEDLIEGDGPTAQDGDTVSVDYVGVAYSTGKEFDASFGGPAPFDFTIGAGDVIAGWDQGIAGMKVGGRRELTIPPDLAYGAQGFPPAIGPDETLVFVVDLVAIR